MPDITALRRLSSAYGIETQWHDIWGVAHQVSASTLRDLLAAMRVAAADDEQILASLQAHEAQVWSDILPQAVVVRLSALPVQLTLRLPADATHVPLTCRLTEENGAVHTRPLTTPALVEVSRAEIDGRRLVALQLALDFDLPAGYHVLQVLRQAEVVAETLVIVAPDACYAPESVRNGARVFGPAAQLYALRSERNWGVGDFSDLRLLTEQWAKRGAGIVGVNPLHALFPHNPEHASPYSPSSRLFLNPLYLDPERIAGARESEVVRQKLSAAEFRARIAELRNAELIDYRKTAAFKFSVLEALYADFVERHVATDSSAAHDFRDFRQRAGEALERHALFEALQEYFHRIDGSVWGWPVWPEAYRDPNSAAVTQFAAEQRVRVDFFAWLQWQADLQLGAAAELANELGMPIGLYGDLAVSVDRGGAETWREQHLYALRTSIGAPPDDFNLTGQNWGLPPAVPAQLTRARYAPFIATLRANMRHTGALRVDHVMGLQRLFWIPESADAAAGAYVRYPATDLLGILALESHRNRCMVVGEDLGTVPDEIRLALSEVGALTYRLLYFERQERGGFKAPGEYTSQALVAATTHDLPTLAGFWEGRDLLLRGELGLFPSEQVREHQVLERAQDRARLLLALEREGLLPPGVSPDPASSPVLTPALALAVHVYLARTPCRVCMIQLEDVLGMRDQVNLPGTSTQYPNWRRKLTQHLEQWPQDERFTGLCRALAEIRPLPAAAGKSAPSATVPQRRLPLATYRLQLRREFNFADATAIVPYLARLGVSHVYCSPYLRARAGSAHGYDVIDHATLNPELGTRAEFEQFALALRGHDLGQLLDVVPNHMGVMGNDNQWWLDVLENGRASLYAEFFDIEWDPVNPALRGKVLVPVLGDHYGVVLERGELRLAFDAEGGSFSVFYFDNRFPVDPRDYARILERAALALPATDPPAAARVEFQSLITAFSHLPARDGADANLIAERNRDKEVHKRRLADLCRTHSSLQHAVERAAHAFGEASSGPDRFLALHELLEAQAYRLAYWRVASDEINYRRFFDINELAALRMDNETVFDATHGLLLELIASGTVDGLRIDHPDGLYDPEQYFRRLQDRIAELPGNSRAAAPGRHHLPMYLVVEKITAGHERMPTSWPVHGTTGYRFANVVNGLFVDTAARTKLDRIYAAFTGEAQKYEEVVYHSKRLILRTALASELTVLSNQLTRVAQADRHTRDFTFNTLRGALVEVIACFPVYRTYVADSLSAQDRRFIEWAVARAKRRSRAADVTIFDFVLNALLCRTAATSDPAVALATRAFARKFQQLTAPVTAKGMEDTAFYRYNRLVSLNEVGGNPDQFGFTLSAFHGASQDRAEHWPFTMLSTSTHDSKRSEDVRARINVISEMPGAWRLSLRRWNRINRSKKRKTEDGLAPSLNDEYLLYQILLGSWPLESLDAASLGQYRERIQAYLIKAAREAKVHTSWVNVNAEYESALTEFAGALLSRLDGNLFLDDFLPSQRTVAWLGLLNSLSQTAIKLASPGVPDIFQGQELWDFSLADPDNRRPVDYARRTAALAALDEGSANLQSLLRGMLAQPEDGRCKLYVTQCALRLRRARPDLFQLGDYAPLTAVGTYSQRLVAFGRRHDGRGVILVAPRLLAGLVKGWGQWPLGDLWSDTLIPIPWLPPQASLHNALTGARVAVHTDEGGPALVAREVLRDFPTALLEF